MIMRKTKAIPVRLLNVPQEEWSEEDVQAFAPRDFTQAELDAYDAEQTQMAADKLAYEASEEYALEQRREAYVVAGATVEGVLEAVFEMLVEDRPEKAQAMKIKRQEIKDLFPKPVV